MAKSEKPVTVMVMAISRVSSQQPDQRIARVNIAAVGSTFVRRQSIVDAANEVPEAGMNLFLQGGMMYVTGDRSQTERFRSWIIEAAEEAGYTVTNKDE